MISLTPLRTLDLASPPAPGRPAHVSAASGLVAVGEFLYVAADDELHLGIFPASGDGPGRLIRLFHGSLPDDGSARKASKPDLETLLLLPPTPGHPAGMMLAMGSGSTPRRFRGALLPLAENGALSGQARPIDLTPLYGQLAEIFPALNIEGGIVSGSTLTLFQRGNKAEPLNAIVRYDMPAGLPAALTASPSPVISPLDLGMLDGIPLAITDAALLPDGAADRPEGCFVFSAVAEDTDDPYRDGPVVGAAIGIAQPDGRVLRIDPIDRTIKLEGVFAIAQHGVARLLLVDDHDDPDVAARLYSATLVL